MSEKMVKMEDLNWTLIDKNGKVKMISWGEDYHTWSHEKKLEYAESVASVMNEAADKMQKERNKLLTTVEELEFRLQTAQQQIDQQKQIIINNITQSNDKNIADKESIVLLQNLVREKNNEIKSLMLQQKD